MLIKGEKFIKINNQRLNGVDIYKSTDCSKYLRVGNLKAITAEASYIENLHSLRFPVPKVLRRGKIGGLGYYIESSIGVTTFGERFQREFLLKRKVTSNTFKSFCEVVCIFFDAQLNSLCSLSEPYDLKKIIMLNNVLRENPDLDRKKVKNCLQKIKERLSLLPNVFSHGDLTPRNVFNNGVIDFEFHFISPAGLDVLTAPIIENFWNFQDKNGKKYEMFYLNRKQIDYYFSRIDVMAKGHGIDSLLTFVDDFILLKAFWMLAYEKKFYKISGDESKWKFRKRILIYCMESYLNNKRIDVDEFIKFGLVR